jgi:hypothetical protein
MKKIRDILSEAPTTNLTDAQKGMLVTVFASATPQQAFDMASGSPNTIQAKDELVRLGLVQQSANQLALSPSGKDALYNNNLVDQTGQLTPEGETQLKDFETNKQEYVNLEAYQLILTML